MLDDAKETLEKAKNKATELATGVGEKLGDFSDNAKEVIEDTPKKTKIFFQKLFGK